MGHVPTTLRDTFVSSADANDSLRSEKLSKAQELGAGSGVFSTRLDSIPARRMETA